MTRSPAVPTWSVTITFRNGARVVRQFVAVNPFSAVTQAVAQYHAGQSFTTQEAQ